MCSEKAMCPCAVWQRKRSASYEGVPSSFSGVRLTQPSLAREGSSNCTAMRRRRIFSARAQGLRLNLWQLGVCLSCVPYTETAVLLFVGSNTCRRRSSTNNIYIFRWLGSLRLLGNFESVSIFCVFCDDREPLLSPKRLYLYA